MIIDSEARTIFKRKLQELVGSQVNGLVTGTFPDLAAMERHRGIIVGLGMALDLLEDPATPPEKLSEEDTHEQSSD